MAGALTQAVKKQIFALLECSRKFFAKAFRKTYLRRFAL